MKLPRPVTNEEYKRMEKKEEITPDDYSEIINEVLSIAREDVEDLHYAEQSYGDSWKKRGGVGAFMMLARKWDRIEKQVEEHNWDVFKAQENDQREEGISDDIMDLRRYLFLVEAEMNLRIHGNDSD